MATLILQAAGAAAGGMLGPAGAMIGRAVGGLAGAALDRAVLGGGSGRTVSAGSARLKDIEVTASTEGSAIPRIYGRARVAGQIIWATRILAVTTTRTSSVSGGGKSSGGHSSKTKVKTRTTAYYANLALGLCEGPIARIGRVWADGKPLDTSRLAMRLYTGGEEQMPDPLIVAKEGGENAPTYRGLAYVVFERLPLARFGDRVPQLAFEVIRPVGALEQGVRSVTLIPGATEFGYDTRPVARILGIGASASENRHVTGATTDFAAAMDELETLCPNLEHVSLVVSWFGDDLRCGVCTVAPRVDSKIKRTSGGTWSVAGLNRGSARLVSSYDGRPAYGGTPSDASVIHAIQDLKARGLKVTLYPFLMMDIPAENTLPDPHSGTAPQPAYPWRGQITSEASGTADAAAEMDHFFGHAVPGHFHVSGSSVGYSGPSEWGWRRFVLHMAALGKAAGGVDAVLIGSEFRELTRVRDEAGAYPAVAELVSLAADVRTLAGVETKITYAADWTEYGAHVLDGGAEVRFPLDPLWASDDVDAVGVDWYAPMADWREEAGHADAALAASIYDQNYLAGNVTGGEDYDWYYASEADRAAQVRTPITDGLGKPWVFRAKDFQNWWGEPHVERVGGAELPEPTAWVPQSKPIWLTEFGCPAIDKGANEPNVFPDPKSAASGVPHFSNGRRDDQMQRAALQAMLHRWDPTQGGNPVSSLYGGPMVDPERITLWTWDARPYPVFPLSLGVWADGPAHETGHWLTGRLGQTPLADLVSALVQEGASVEADSAALIGVVDGYALDRPASVREALEPLADLFAFSVVEREGKLVFRPRGQGEPVSFAVDELAVEGSKRPEPALVRAQESEIATEIAIGFSDTAEFRARVARGKRQAADIPNVDSVDTALVADPEEMARRAEIRLQDLWVAREQAGFSLPPSALALEPGDMVALPVGARQRLFEISSIADGALRRVEAVAIAPDIFDAPKPRRAAGTVSVPALPGPPQVMVLDLPALQDDGVLSWAAVAAEPWPGGVVLWRENAGSFEPAVVADRPAIVGETVDALGPGPVWRLDGANTVTVTISAGELFSSPLDAVLNGANAAAIQNPDGGCEVLQFCTAELIGPSTYRLSGLLRGQSGTELEASIIKPPGSAFVLLDEALVPLATGIEALGRPMIWRVAPSGADHADPMAVEWTSTPSGTALRPLEPVHLKGHRTDEGVALAWIRRTRISGDAWEVAEVPLGEASEAYRVELLDGAGAIVRAFGAPEPALLYPAADELADFGAVQASLRVRVAQVSAVLGPGRFTEQVVHV